MIRAKISLSSASQLRQAHSTAFGGTAPVYPNSNADISVTKGVFDQNPGFQEANAWGAFSNITTAPVPEPSTLAGALVAAAMGVTYARRKRRTVNA